MRNGRARQEPALQSPANRMVRCAIYTRKSTDEGLQQEFNSLDAQRESNQAVHEYIVVAWRTGHAER